MKLDWWYIWYKIKSEAREAYSMFQMLVILIFAILVLIISIEFSVISIGKFVEALNNLIFLK